LPGIEVGCVLVFVYGIGSFVTPVLLGGPAGTMLGVVIQTALNDLGDPGLAAAGAVLITVAVLMILGVYRWQMAGSMEWLAARDITTPLERTIGKARRRSRLASVGRPLLSAVARALDRSGVSRTQIPLLACAVIAELYLVLPQFVGIPVSFSATRTLIFPPPALSFRWYGEFLSASWLQPAATSTVIATAVGVVATTIGALAAIGIVRGRLPGWASGLVTGCLLLPLLIPTVVAALALYLAYAPLRLTDSVLGLVLAHGALAVPFAFVIVSGSVRALDPTYERAAVSLGARRPAVLRRIVLPLIRPAFVVALFFSFLTSFDETVVAIFLSGVHVKTLPARMFEAVAQQSDPTVGVVATISLLVALLALMVTARMARGGQELTGRSVA
jgi:putative spermidine/putrescine transport system permease protein